MKYKQDLTGLRFGRLTVLSYAERHPSAGGSRSAYWLCKCDCGKEKIVNGNHLKSGAIKSCGCLHKETLPNVKHRLSDSRLYSIYKDMYRRCYNRKNKSYPEYGERGIRVCAEWRGVDNFVNFYTWAMTHGYADNLTIDRIDFDGDYSPENCRWVDIYQQANNKRNKVNITIDGVTKTRAEWCREYGINYRTVCTRMSKGIDPVSAITMPIQR